LVRLLLPFFSRRKLNHSHGLGTSKKRPFRISPKRRSYAMVRSNASQTRFSAVHNGTLLHISVSGTAVPGLSPGLLIDLGTSTPLTVEGNLTVNAGGTGSVAATLQDLRVASGATSITLGEQTSSDTVSVQGSAISSLFNSFSLTSSAGGNNTFNIQDQVGETDFGGAVSFQLAGSNTVNLAADAANPGGVSGAVVDLFSTSVFNGGTGTNHKFVGATNVFFVFALQFRNFA